MNNNSNHWSYTGQISFMPMIRTTSNGGSFLPVTLRQESSSVSIALFDVLANVVANGAATGQTISVEGWMTSRKNNRTGYFETALNGQRLSLDNGKTWHTSEPRPAQQQQQPTLHQQIQGFQQPQPQIQTQSGQTQQPQMTQTQPVTQQQQPVNQQFQQPQQQQQNPTPQPQQAQPASMAEFLNSNPYRQGQPVSQDAAQAQQQLYQRDQPQQAQQQAVAQPVQQQSASLGEFDNLDIPF